MATICKKTKTTNGVQFDFADESESVLIVVLDELSDGMIKDLAIHGLSQKVGDSYASSESIPAAIASAQATIDNLKNNLWAVKSGNGGKIVEAFMRATGRTHAECLESFNGMDKAAKAVLRKHPDIMKALAEIEMERAEQLANATGGSDLSELF